MMATAMEEETESSETLSSSDHEEEQLPKSSSGGVNPTAYPESVLFESSRHRFHWSTELPTDARKNIRKNTIYQLMLDTRVELKNGGNKISSTRPAHTPSKKRKKQLSGSLTENGLPDMVNRSPLVTAFELAINSFQLHKLRGYFETNAMENAVLQVDMSALSPIPSMLIYREIKGIRAIVSYLNAYNQVMPDAVQLFWQKSTRKTENGGKEIETDCRMIGTKFNDISIIEDMNVQAEQQILEAAIFGLTSLSQSTPKPEAISVDQLTSNNHHIHEKNENFSLRDQFDREIAEESLSITETLPTPSFQTLSSTTATSASTASASPIPSLTTTTTTNITSTSSNSNTSNTNNTSSSDQPSPQIEPNKKQIRSLDGVTFLIANEHTEFATGKRLDKPQYIDLSGKFIWYLNAQKKIMRIKFIMLKRTSVTPPVTKPVAANTSPHASQPPLPSSPQP